MTISTLSDVAAPYIKGTVASFDTYLYYLDLKIRDKLGDDH